MEFFMKQNVVFLTKLRYDRGISEPSKNSWEYWCYKNNHKLFIHEGENPWNNLFDVFNILGIKVIDETLVDKDGLFLELTYKELENLVDHFINFLLKTVLSNFVLLKCKRGSIKFITIKIIQMIK